MTDDRPKTWQLVLIIVLGTCGALGRGLSIGSLVAPKIVRWVDPGVLNGHENFRRIFAIESPR